MAVLLKQFNDGEIEQVFYSSKLSIKKTAETLFGKYFCKVNILRTDYYINENIEIELSRSCVYILGYEQDPIYLTMQITKNNTVEKIRLNITSLNQLINAFYLIEFYAGTFNFNYKQQQRQKRSKKFELIEKQRKARKWYKFFGSDNPKAKYKFTYMKSLKNLWSNIRKVNNVILDKTNLEQLSPSQINKLKKRTYNKVNLWDVYDYKNCCQMDLKRLRKDKFKIKEIK